MELATSNNQGELSPLEIGIHALHAVPLGQGKKGKGLTAYAGLVGKSQPYISQVRAAAEVFEELHKSTYEVCDLLDKAKHLSAIHAANQPLWPLLVNALLDSGPRVSNCDDGKRLDSPPKSRRSRTRLGESRRQPGHAVAKVGGARRKPLRNQLRKGNASPRRPRP